MGPSQKVFKRIPLSMRIIPCPAVEWMAVTILAATVVVAVVKYYQKHFIQREICHLVMYRKILKESSDQVVWHLSSM